MSHAHHILVIDDDQRLATLLARYLTDAGFLVSAVHHVENARNALACCLFDLLILDIMMPEICGLTFLAETRPKERPPVLLLTAKNSVDDRIHGLSLGADDYLAKPFDPREFLLRVQAILRRAPSKSHGVTYSFGLLVFDSVQGTLRRGETHVPLTVTESKLLSLLLQYVGTPVARTFIAQELGQGLNPRTIDVQVNRLRQKIEPFPSQPRYLQSVRGQGYCIRPEI